MVETVLELGETDSGGNWKGMVETAVKTEKQKRSGRETEEIFRDTEKTCTKTISTA